MEKLILGLRVCSGLFLLEYRDIRIFVRGVSEVRTFHSHLERRETLHHARLTTTRDPPRETESIPINQIRKKKSHLSAPSKQSYF